MLAQLESPLVSPRGGRQDKWSEVKNLHIAKIWCEYIEKAQRDKQFSKKANAAILKGVHELAQYLKTAISRTTRTKKHYKS